MKIKVTIGVCVKNCEHTVGNIVDRISAQDFPHENIEVLFVEEGSKDNTLSLIFFHAPTMNISYRVYHHEWKGLGFSRNVVFKQSQGRYIIWVDDGTLIPSDYVRKQVDFMETHPVVGIATGIIEFLPGKNYLETLENMIELFFVYNNLGGPTKKLPGAGGSIYRVKAIQQVGGFDENIQGATEDTDIAYRILSKGWQIFVTQVKYRRDFNSKLKKIWDKSFWYGYGAHFLLHKHEALNHIKYKGTPLAGFLEGMLISIVVYKLTHKKISFLMALHIFLKRLAWWNGFFKSHLDSYAPKEIM